VIVIISIAEAVKILSEHGMTITPAHLRAGIECGAYPFGVCIPMKQNTYEVYKPLLLKWIEERSIINIEEGA
jgi:hypothetical protein